ncbi:unnamed protein product [Lupinus luteus]|uniref:Integrase catalytic domain-containing protein n=1 Tax=Lupinus luteus TaxID=3873 RepID=A0AAV1YDB4_LUPLU
MMLENSSTSQALSSVNSYDTRQRRRGRGFRGSQAGRSNTQGRMTSNSKGRGHKICTFCQKIGHTEDVCYKKHGFPPSYSNTATNINSYIVSDGKNSEQDEGIKQEFGNETPDIGLAFTHAQHNALKAMIQESMNQTVHTTNQISMTSDAVASSSGNINLNNMHNSITWILDTGATDHVCCTLAAFHNFKRINPLTISLPNGNKVAAKYSRTIIFSNILYISDVLYVPSFNFNLISVSRHVKSLDCTLIFSNNHCEIQDKQSLRMIGAAELKGGLYVLTVSSKHITKGCQVNLFTSYDDANLWHSRLGHLSHRKMQLMQSVFPIIKCVKTSDPCEICHLAKQKRLPYDSSITSSKKCFDLIHIDIWGPISTPSTFGHKYFLTIVDDKSRFTWIFFMKQKSETVLLVKKFVAYTETQFETKIKGIRTDNGQEFMLKDYYLERGIEHQTTCVETPQQNGIVERKHQHILGVARSLVLQSNMPICFWNFAVAYAVHLINRQPSLYLNNKCPYEILFNSLPDISNLRTFGSLCFASTLVNHRKKFDSRSRKCAFLGFKQGTKGFILVDINTNEIFISRNTAFYEHIYPL